MKIIILIIIQIQKCEIFLECLICNFRALAKIVEYFTFFPFHVRRSGSVTVE